MNRNLYFILFFIISIYGYSQEINWISIEEAEIANKKEPRKVFIDVYTDWCGWCKKMDASTFEDPQIIKYLNENYYCVKLDGEDKNTYSQQGRHDWFGIF